MSVRNLTMAGAGLGAALLITPLLYVLFLALDAAPAGAFKNVSQAMEPTLLRGDFFTVRKIPRGEMRVVHRGELVTHLWPVDPTKEFVKRVVAIAGDTLSMTAGRLYLNGRAVAETYAWYADSVTDPVSGDFHWQRAFVIGPASRDTAHYTPSRDNWGPLVVPPGMCFVLGDNRDNSLDSRYWGFLPRSDIVGEVRRIYFSEDSTGRVRWDRLGRRVR